MQSPVRIRPIARPDHAEWRVLWDGYNAFYGREGPTALPGSITQATWERFFNENEPVHAFVAEQDDKVIGLVHYLFHRSTTRRTMSATCKTCSPQATCAGAAWAACSSMPSMTQPRPATAAACIG